MSRGALLAIAVLVLFACTDDDHDSFREDVLYCEEAVAHLEECCPGLRVPSNACNFSYEHQSGCGSTTDSYVCPAFPVAESRRIRNAACDDLLRNAECERAASLAPRTRSRTVSEGDPGSGYGSSYNTGSVACP